MWALVSMGSLVVASILLVFITNREVENPHEPLSRLVWGFLACLFLTTFFVGYGAGQIFMKNEIMSQAFVKGVAKNNKDGVLQLGETGYVVCDDKLLNIIFFNSKDFSVKK